MKISDIKIGNRFRQDLGDIHSLAESIKLTGLVQPVPVDENNNLIAGRRRIEAFKILGRDEIPVTVVSVNDMMTAEIHENTIRKNFTFEERAIIREKYKPKLQKVAEARQKTGRKPSGKLPQGGRVSELLGSYFGIGRKTNDKEERIYEGVKNNPEQFGRLPQKIDSGFSISKACRMIEREEKKQQLLKQYENKDWTNSDWIFVCSTSGKRCQGFGLPLSDEQIADLRRQLDERENRPHYWWLSEEEREKEIQKDKEYEEFDKKHSTVWKQPSAPPDTKPTLIGKRLDKHRASKKEIIDWLSTMDDAARFHVRISYQEKFPPRNRPSPPVGPFDEEYFIKVEQ